MIVYRHVIIETGQVFYIGCGISKTRTKQKTFKSVEWYNLINRHANLYRIDILLEGISFDEARIRELQFINHYGLISNGGSLVNLNTGSKKWDINSIEKINPDDIIPVESFNHRLRERFTLNDIPKPPRGIETTTIAFRGNKAIIEAAKSKYSGKLNMLFMQWIKSLL